jgi:hypothetical protein
MKASKSRYLATAFILTAAFHVPAQAENLTIQGNPSGSEVVIQLDPSLAGKKIQVFAAASQATHQVADIAVAGGGGEVVTAQGFSFLATEPELNGVAAGGIPLELYASAEKYDQLIIPLDDGSDGGGSSSSIPGGGGGDPDPSCGCLTPEVKEQLLAAFRRNNPNLTEQAFCKLWPAPPSGSCGSSGSSSSEGSELGGKKSVSATAFIPFNRCDPKLRHGVVVTIDLKDVAADKLTGRSLVVATKLRKQKGQSKAAFKISDGKKFPGWISLTASLSNHSPTDQIQFVNYDGHSRLRVRTASKRGDIVPYNQVNYKRTPINNMLKGGRGTVEVTKYGEGYSFCANFTKRKRQEFNGYKKMR